MPPRVARKRYQTEWFELSFGASAVAPVIVPLTVWPRRIGIASWKSSFGGADRPAVAGAANSAAATQTATTDADPERVCRAQPLMTQRQ